MPRAPSPSRITTAGARLALTIIAVIAATIVAGCSLVGKASGISLPLPIPGASTTQPTPSAGGTSVVSARSPTPAPTPPSADAVVDRYLRAWEKSDYNAMYDLLSTRAQATISREKFVARYQAITAGATITQVIATAEPAHPLATSQITPTMTAAFHLTVRTVRVGEFTDDNAIPLVLENGQWRVDWTPDLIFRGLGTENLVRMYPDDPMRGSILDRNGQPLAVQGALLQIGVIPGQIKDQNALIDGVTKYLSMTVDTLKARIANAQPDWWVPLETISMAKRDEAMARLGNIAGVRFREVPGRVYPNGPLAAHTIGYVTRANADDLKKHPGKYEEDDWIGRAGIEASFNDLLAGQKGGRLAIVTPEGETVRLLARRAAVPGQDVRLSIDINVQRLAEETLGDKVGSIVVMDPRDNSILALASNPRFDPNSFVLGFSNAEWQKLNTDPNHPFQNRPVQSAYPTGSIFKTITMAAGMEQAGFKADSPFVCTGRYEAAPGLVMGDWVPQGHGRLNLMEGLTESCDIVFYTVGRKIYDIDPHILSNFARAFGLGQPTGVVGLDENPGTLPDPEWKQNTLKQAWFPGDTINLAIGQGYLEATPLQMANAYSALATGVLRTPVLVMKAGDRQYQAQDRGRLPISDATARAIKTAMIAVASSPQGTAYYAFKGYPIPIAAKTGSAENQNPNAHAWFASYGPADAPKAVVVVMIEGGQHGGSVAAPLGRKIYEGLLR